MYKLSVKAGTVPEYRHEIGLMPEAFPRISIFFTHFRPGIVYTKSQKSGGKIVACKGYFNKGLPCFPGPIVLQ